MREKYYVRKSLFMFSIILVAVYSNATTNKLKVVPEITPQVAPIDRCAEAPVIDTEPCLIYGSLCVIGGEYFISVSVDSDCDGYSDEDEKLAGTDPNCCFDFPGLEFIVIVYDIGDYGGCGSNELERASNNMKYDVFIRVAAEANNAPPCLLKALLAYESSGLQPYIKGSRDKNDWGIAQLNVLYGEGCWCFDCKELREKYDRPAGCQPCGEGCPENWPYDNTPWNPEDAINCADRVLQKNYNYFPNAKNDDERWKFAIATYNAGPQMRTCEEKAIKWHWENNKPYNYTWQDVYNYITSTGCDKKCKEVCKVDTAPGEVTKVWELYTKCR